MPTYQKNIVAHRLLRIKGTIQVLEERLDSLKEDVTQLTLELEELNLDSQEILFSSQSSDRISVSSTQKSSYIAVDFFNKPIKVGDLVKSRTYPKHNGIVDSINPNWVYLINSKNQRKYKKAHNLVNQSANNKHE